MAPTIQPALATSCEFAEHLRLGPLRLAQNGRVPRAGAALFQKEKAARFCGGFSVAVGRNYCILRPGGTMKAARSLACADPAPTMRATSIQNGPTGMWAYFLRA